MKAQLIWPEMGFGTLFNQKHKQIIAGVPFSFHFHFLNEKIQAKTFIVHQIQNSTDRIFQENKTPILSYFGPTLPNLGQIEFFSQISVVTSFL